MQLQAGWESWEIEFAVELWRLASRLSVAWKTVASPEWPSICQNHAREALSGNARGDLPIAPQDFQTRLSIGLSNGDFLRRRALPSWAASRAAGVAGGVGAAGWEGAWRRGFS